MRRWPRHGVGDNHDDGNDKCDDGHVDYDDEYSHHDDDGPGGAGDVAGNKPMFLSLTDLRSALEFAGNLA